MSKTKDAQSLRDVVAKAASADFEKSTNQHHFREGDFYTGIFKNLAKHSRRKVADVVKTSARIGALALQAALESGVLR